MRVRGPALVVASAVIAVLLSSIGIDATTPAPVALIASWARDTPIAGLRCSGVLLDERHVATAEHCLDGTTLTVAGGATLCERLDDSLPRVVAGVRRPQRGRPAEGDLAIVELDSRAAASRVLTGIARPGPATVHGFGVHPGFGRAACRPARYRGELGPCDRDVGAAWCLSAAAGDQLCGGSSGAPVFMPGRAGIELIGVVSAGPTCGDPGPVIVATFSGEVLSAAR